MGDPFYSMWPILPESYPKRFNCVYFIFYERSSPSVHPSRIIFEQRKSRFLRIESLQIASTPMELNCQSASTLNKSVTSPESKKLRAVKLWDFLDSFLSKIPFLNSAHLYLHPRPPPPPTASIPFIPSHPLSFSKVKLLRLAPEVPYILSLSLSLSIPLSLLTLKKNRKL